MEAANVVANCGMGICMSMAALDGAVDSGGVRTRGLRRADWGGSCRNHGDSVSVGGTGVVASVPGGVETVGALGTLVCGALSRGVTHGVAAKAREGS